MRNHTDTYELRQAFAERFLASPIDHAREILDGPMEQLITEFDAELAHAKRRWSYLNADAEFAAMDRWLSERGYVDSEAIRS